MSNLHKRARALSPALKVSAVAVALALSGAAQAVQFNFDNGFSGSLDSTFSYGISVRAQSASPSLIGLANGGTSRSTNEDDGDRSYAKGKPFSQLWKGTHELSAKYDGWSMLVRGSYFVDTEASNAGNLGPIGRDRLGQDAVILDAFVARTFDFGGKNVNVRAGKQVISWGESTFIPNGINVINPVDVSKLRTPGSELKEAFIPTSTLFASFELSKQASLEAFALFNHDKFKLDPRGAYFSNNDTASDDSTELIFSFGRRKDLFRGQKPGNFLAAPGSALFPTTQALGYGPFDPAGAVWAPRTADRNAKDTGQFGAAFRYLATELNNTEFGAYYLNYHSRTPVLSGVRGTPTSIVTGGPLATAVGHTGTASYFVQYPEDIKLYGFSFNTQAPAGIALQGEISYRPNQPLQLASAEVVLAAVGLPNLLTGFATIPGTVSATAPVGASAAFFVPAGTEIVGWRRVKQTQMQLTGTKSFPNVFGATQGVVVGEVGYTRYNGLTNSLKFSGPATGLPATVQGAVAGQAGSVQTEGFVTENSWGYRLVGRLEYANALFGGNLAPRAAFSHDVSGVSQTFNQGVKSISLGSSLEFQRRLNFDFSYNMFFGGRNYCGTDQITNAAAQSALAVQISGIPALGIAPQGARFCSNANPIRDRDFYSFSVSYSF
ncbi:MAG: DUF1302 domain-containing protein [Burkholderiales bacterium]|nr:DUF1302 domain-containing protein [Burkholderiales bacterium]